MAKESVFTDHVLAIMEDAAPLDWAKAQELSTKLGIKPKAIVAAATRHGIEYRKIERKTKSGEKIRSKADLVALIAAQSKVAVEALDGLEKATKNSLEALLD